ncbi:uncharacterized protein FRV6_16505 [Fusarium oxysporum]|uniref:SAP domain-containing protein n=1 Tax=Fusarium oxysporum TaxID=5507 RepID=A0A2H3TUV1_FUSOX|nr:uncharacterized protein FRV6_16505 [Fusarium oxysporum]
MNKLFKQYYCEEMDIYELEEERNGKTEWSVKDRRIMTTWIVKKLGTSWETAGDISIKSEELVDRLCDEEELSFGPDEYFDDDTLIYVLKRMKVPQLKELAGRKKISTQGNKSGIVEWLRIHLITEELVGGSITVQIDDPDVVFDVEVIQSYS